ncbi:MAG: 16S rRNA (guanine(527)-N(7))-methyltransferase RsmG [Desulfatitalea sp.]|nr:16S rRNA (guanine(527)-N(7))-methyltransferase RsmG [Desulfatitalea sp.]NNJ99313.1 16S rRNA (guanine(527)-N(7))-methyltransferase RsmG [Desulfatitalea sp.]
MRVGDDQWLETLIQGARQFGVRVEHSQAVLMAGHADALLHWNRKTNLTRIVDPLEVAVKHFVDAIAPLAEIPECGELLDIGTGGGFPGLPLKIMRPDQSMLLIDGSRKKISFVREVIRRLALPAARAEQWRVEALGARVDCRHKFDVIVCRAWTHLQTATRMALPLLASGGRLIVYQGPEDAPAEDVRQGAASVDGCVVASLDYCLPFLGDRRSVKVLTHR